MLALIGLLALATLGCATWCLASAARGGLRAAPGERPAVAAVAAAAAGGALLRWLVLPGHHAMYVDEPWYAEAACRLARSGELALCEATWAGERCVPYAKAWGWPIVLAPLAWALGCHGGIGIAVGRVLGVLAIPLAAVAVRSAGGSWWPAACAALLVAALPVHVEWSVTAETNVPAATAFLAGLCGALLYLRDGRPAGACLAVAAFGLAAAIRPESAAAGAVAAAVLAVAAPAPLPGRLLTAAGILLGGGAMLFAAAGLWSMNESISGGAFLSVANIGHHLAALAGAGGLASGALLLAACAAAAFLLRGDSPPAAVLLIGVTLAGGGVALAYDRFHERMLLVAAMGLLPLCGLGLGSAVRAPAGARLRRIAAAGGGILVAAILGLWVQRLLAARVPETQLLETRLAARVAAYAVPADALLLAAQPTVLAAAGVANVMATRVALADRARLDARLAAGDAVFFLCDMFCEPGFQAAAGSPGCREVLTDYALAPVVTESLHGRTYGLYRIEGRAPAGHAPPDCPRADRDRRAAGPDSGG